jgi:hypothetical protein
MVIVFALFAACASNKGSDPPPRSPAAAEASSPDGGLPMMPLNRKGVVVPSDVRLQPAPTAVAPQTADLPSATATPRAN